MSVRCIRVLLCVFGGGGGVSVQFQLIAHQEHSSAQCELSLCAEPFIYAHQGEINNTPHPTTPLGLLLLLYSGKITSQLSAYLCLLFTPGVHLFTT